LRIAAPEVLEALAELSGSGASGGFAASQLTEAFELGGDIFHAVGLRRIDGQPERLQLRHLPGRIAGFPGDHQVRLQRADHFKVEALVAADPRHFFCSGRVIAEFDGAD